MNAARPKIRVRIVHEFSVGREMLIFCFVGPTPVLLGWNTI